MNIESGGVARRAGVVSGIDADRIGPSYPALRLDYKWSFLSSQLTGNFAILARPPFSAPRNFARNIVFKLYVIPYGVV